MRVQEVHTETEKQKQGKKIHVRLIRSSNRCKHSQMIMDLLDNTVLMPTQSTRKTTSKSNV